MCVKVYDVRNSYCLLLSKHCSSTIHTAASARRKQLKNSAASGQWRTITERQDGNHSESISSLGINLLLPKAACSKFASYIFLWSKVGILWYCTDGAAPRKPKQFADEIGEDSPKQVPTTGKHSTTGSQKIANYDNYDKCNLTRLWFNNENLDYYQ